MATLTDIRKERGQYWSQSRVGTFLLCSLKYAFQYICKLPAEQTPAALPFGNAVHRTLEMLHLHQKDGRLLTDSEVRELFSEIWSREMQETPDIRFKEGDDAGSCRKQGQDLVSIFRANLPEDERIISVSEAFAVPLVAADGTVLDDPLIGEADLVVERNGSMVIVDWKTAARKWSADQADTQLQPTALSYAYYQAHGEIPGFEYRIAVKTKTPGYQTVTTQRTVAGFMRLAEVIRAIGRAIRAEAFLPADGCFACGDCQYACACKRWVQDRGRLISQSE